MDVPLPQTIFVSAVFGLTCFFIIHPMNRSLALPFGVVPIVLDFATAPPTAVLFLKFLDLLSWPDICHGIWGVEGLRPLTIINIFFTLAYCSISVDLTGALEAAALYVLGKAGSSNHPLVGIAQKRTARILR